MPLGTIILMIVGILIFFGLAQRVLDRMRLNDRTALAIIGLAVVGSFIDITINTGPSQLVINLGGSLIPVALAIWLIATADSATERWRALLGAVAAGAVLYGVSRALPREPQPLPVDPVYLFAVLAGLIAYVLGRSRRGAFTAAILGVTLADLAAWVEMLVTRTPGRAWLGGAGMLDATVIAGLVAVLFAEVLGESLELAAGGPRATRQRRRQKTGELSDMSPRGSDEMTKTSSLVEESALNIEPRTDRPASQASYQLRQGDLDRVELEEPAQLEEARRSPTDETGRGRRAISRTGEERGSPSEG